MRNYYYLLSSLPELAAGTKKSTMALEAFVEFCGEEMHPQDFEDLRKMLLFRDMKNVLNYETKREAYLTPAYYSEDDFNENMKDTDTFLPFIAEYLDARKYNRPVYTEYHPADRLALHFYENLETLSDSSFVKGYYEAEFVLRNALAAMSMRKSGQMPNKLLPVGDYADAIMKSQSPDFGLSGEFPFLGPLSEAFMKKEAAEKEQLADDARWQLVDGLAGDNVFAADYIFGIAVKMQTVDRWARLSPEKGRQKLDQLIETIKNSISFSPEFLTIGGKR